MKIAERKIKLLPSDAPDVVDHRFYYIEAPAVVTFDSDFVSIGNTLDIDGYLNADLSVLLQAAALDGVFNVGVAGVDDVGNESPMSKASNFPLDFVAPPVPGPIIEL